LDSVESAASKADHVWSIACGGHGMQIHISKDSEVPIRDQLAEELALLIGTGGLKPGEVLPSVRTLARQLKIHYNTVSEAYQDLVDRTLVVRRLGSRMAVRSLEAEASAPRVRDLDDLINAAIKTAQGHGYTLQQLRQRVRERLMAQPPDHILVVEKEAGLRQILRTEIEEGVRVPVASCSPSDFPLNRGLPIGALVVCHAGAQRTFENFVPKDCPILPIWFSAADEHVTLVRQLRQPSLIAVVSVSQQIIQTARGLLAHALEKRHTLQPYLWPNKRASKLRAADIVFCDSIAHHKVKARRVIHYRLISPDSMERLTAAFDRRPQFQ
jgi:GntR family transcriptional regulator